MGVHRTIAQELQIYSQHAPFTIDGPRVPTEGIVTHNCRSYTDTDAGADLRRLCTAIMVQPVNGRDVLLAVRVPCHVPQKGPGGLQPRESGD